MPPSGGPKIHPSPLHDCARLMRVAANRGAPSTVVYGFAIVSRNVSPVAIVQTPARNPTNAIFAETAPVCTSELIWVAGTNQNPPIATDSQTHDDALLVPELARQNTRRHRHKEVNRMMRELHPCRLGFGQPQLVLEVLVHNVDHPVAHRPE